MATKIILARGGSKKRPFHSIVIADERAPRDGNFIEKIGNFNPMVPKDNKERVTISYIFDDFLKPQQECGRSE